MNISTKQKQTHRHRKQMYDYQRERQKEEIRNLGLTGFTTIYEIDKQGFTV